ncbi:hypothetical protein WDJ51_01945 [Rathayibacter sp. YIM 133350]|uniref:hypothetical protein n=1 Tax=Rathayibacter sp. YIM 133350 TaxID=3131992 RepID=UPI00307CDEEB
MSDAPVPNRVLVWVLRIVLVAEAVLVVGVAVWFLMELLTATPASFASAVAIFVILVIAAVFVCAIAVGAARGASWIRGAAFTWQLIQLAIAVGAFQGLYAQPAIGWALIVPSVLVMVLLVLPTVRVAFAPAPSVADEG